MKSQDGVTYDDHPPLDSWPSWVSPNTGNVRGVSDSYPGARFESATVSGGREQADALVQSSGSNWKWEWPEWITSFFTWFGDFFSLWGMSGWVVVLVLLGIVFLVIIFVILARTDWGRNAVAGKQSSVRKRKAVAKEELPFELEAMNLNMDRLLQHATTAKKQGDYRRALMFLYSYLLVELDAHQLIRLSRGKTNRDYGRELHGIPVVYGCFLATMEAFERVFFGRVELESAQVEELFSQVVRLELK